MNARNLNKRSATDWARIDRMTDEEIDTSDIPPLDDAFFRTAKWRLPRLDIDQNDLREALKFATYIIKEALHDKKKRKKDKDLLHAAFNTSLIISYSRPFSGNRNLEGEQVNSLDRDTCRILSKSETELHRRILDLRDTAYAHSDARRYRIAGVDYRKSTFMSKLMYRTENLTKQEAVTLKIMIEKWLRHLGREKLLLQRRLAHYANDNLG